MSSFLPVLSFHRFARAVTAVQPSVPAPASASHNHIAAFRRSRTAPSETRDTTSCEYTSETMSF